MPEPVTAPSSWAGPFSLSADGKRLVFVDRNADTTIVRAQLDPARRELAAPPREVFAGSFELREQAVSPDASWIVFTNEDLPQELHLVRPDGTDYRQLTEGPSRNRQGAWSPKGDWIVFQTDRDADSLAVIHPDGGGWQALPVGPMLSTPSWSPDGSTIAAYDNIRGGVLFDVKAGLDAPIPQLLPPVEPNVLFWPTAWSADGESLVGSTARGGKTQEIVVYSLAAREYLPNRWPTTDGLSVAFVTPRRLAWTDDHDLYLGDLDTGESTRLYTAPAGHEIHNLSAARDGGWLVWTDHTDESDIWLMTLDDTPEARP